MGIQDTIKSGNLYWGGYNSSIVNNSPSEYKDRNRQYYSGAGSFFEEQYARFSNDYMDAKIEGVYRKEPLKWTKAKIRLSGVVNPTATTTKQMDDYKMMMVVKPEIDYLRPGAKVRTMGSTWLVTNTENMSSVGASALIQRCTTVWNHLDFYGNVLSEPLAIDKELARANEHDVQKIDLLTKGYFDCKCQYNENTRQLGENSRIILGRSAYRVTGFSDFTQEFTGDYDSARMLQFTLRYEEPNEEVDDMERHIAEGKTFSWEIVVPKEIHMVEGEVQTITPKSIRNGEEVISGSCGHEISYNICSDNGAVVWANPNGEIKATGEGTAKIRVSLAQNPTDIFADIEVAVSAAKSEGVVFRPTPKSKLSAYESAEIIAIPMKNGTEAEGEVVQWEFSGADEDAYSTEVIGNKATVFCWGGSEKNLAVTARFGEAGIATHNIELEGI